jgi:hypothetical protein
MMKQMDDQINKSEAQMDILKK